MVIRMPAFFSGLFLVCISSARAAGQGFPDDFRLVVGDMRPGSGVAVGLQYQRSHFRNGLFDLRLDSRVSIRLYQRYEAEIVFPHLFDERFFAEFLGVYRSHTQIDYFGLGPESSPSDHSNYHLEGPALYGTVGFRPGRRIAVGGRLGRIFNDLHGGRSSSVPSVEETFAPLELPGLAEEPDHLLLSAFAALDFRDDRFVPRRGTYLEIQATRYRDQSSDRFHFDEFLIEAQHYIPLRRRITYAFRVRGLFARTEEGSEIPFFLLPSLGGTTSLHAFENDRFRDRNLLFINNELRYQATPEIRLEAFFDGGQVFPSADALRFSSFELSTGMGVRYIAGDKVFAGLSLGVGREGLRVSVKGDFRF